MEKASQNTFCESEAFAINYSNEPRVAEQYYLDRINMSDAWQSIGDSGVYTETRVAVLDSGLDVDHVEAISSYLNAYSVDVTKTGHPKLSQLATPYEGEHGTAVWGVIRANPSNNVGITGMYLPVDEGYNLVIKVMAVKTKADGADASTIEYLIEGIEHAVESGASVINMSCSTYENNQVFHEAIQDAYSANVTIVGSAGNDGSSANTYPSCWDEVIGVAATDTTNEPASWTNNNNNVDICAPGSNILSLTLNDRYDYLAGTSLSAPMVAGTAALMQSLYVHDTLSPNTIKNALKQTATDLSDVNDWDNDLLNAGKAVQYARYLAIRDEQLRIRSVTLSANNKPRVAWYPVNFSSCDGYRILRSTSQDGTYSAVATLECEDFYWNGNNGYYYWFDQNVQSGQTYYYKVRAYVKFGDSRRFGSMTNVKSITIP